MADEALGLAPVPMPDVPIVSWTWSFLETPTMGELPTLSSVALQAKAIPVTADFIDIVTRAGIEGLDGVRRTLAEIRRSGDLLRLMQTLRQQIQRHPSTASRSVAEYVGDRAGALPVEHARLLLALADLYAGRSVRHLNSRPPGTNLRRAVRCALKQAAGSTCSVAGAVVFVGLGNARVARAGQSDTYHTAYGSADGIDFSGVEIHATALSNLLTGTTLRPAGPPTLILVLSWLGLALGCSVYGVRTRGRVSKRARRCGWEAVAAAAALIIAYFIVAGVAFQVYYTVLPLIVPVAVQLPVALAGLTRASRSTSAAGSRGVPGNGCPWLHRRRATAAPRPIRTAHGRISPVAGQHRPG